MEKKLCAMEIMEVIDNKFWRNKKVFITGHTGFKGAWLTFLLRILGAKVWGYSLEVGNEPNLFRELTSQSHHLLNNDLFHNIGNILNQEDLDNAIQSCEPDIVFHLAAQALVRKSYNEPINTWETNVIGSLKVLESLRKINNNCAVVMVTTDKVYQNNEWVYGYRETDRLGGNDPYSASKASCEIAIASWKKSFCGIHNHQTSKLAIATARAGNVIGGGDWSQDRIIPDVVRSLIKNKPIIVRNPEAIRPWQHVLDPLSGYLILAQNLSKTTYENTEICDAFNFGPDEQNQIKVSELVNLVTKYWPGDWDHVSSNDNLKESNLLTLQIEKAKNILNWKPKWDLKETAEHTINWYKKFNAGEGAYECCEKDILDFLSNKNN